MRKRRAPVWLAAGVLSLFLVFLPPPAAAATSRCTLDKIVSTGLHHHWLVDESVSTTKMKDCVGGTAYDTTTREGGVSAWTVLSDSYPRKWVPSMTVAKAGGLGTNVSVIKEIGTTDFTLSVWFRTSSVSGNPVLLTSSGGNYQTILEINLMDNALVFKLTGGLVVRFIYYWTSISNFIDGQWHHAAMTREGLADGNETVSAYFDGTVVPHVNSPANNYVTDKYGKVNLANINYNDYFGFGLYGMDLDTTDYYEGDMDDVRIYNRSLSADEVAQIADKTKFLNPLGFEDCNVPNGANGLYVKVRQMYGNGTAQCLYNPRASPTACYQGNTTSTFWTNYKSSGLTADLDSTASICNFADSGSWSPSKQAMCPYVLQCAYHLTTTSTRTTTTKSMTNTATTSESQTTSLTATTEPATTTGPASTTSETETTSSETETTTSETQSETSMTESTTSETQSETSTSETTTFTPTTLTTLTDVSQTTSESQTSSTSLTSATKSRTATTSKTQSGTRTSTSRSLTATRSLTPTATFTKTATAVASCNDHVMLCQKCFTNRVLIVKSDQDARDQMTDTEYLLFHDRVSGGASAVIDVLGTYPMMYVAVTKTQVCFELANSTTVSASDILSGLNMADSVCTDCFGGLPSLTLNSLLMVQTASEIQYATVSAGLSDIDVFAGLSLSNLEMNVTYNKASYSKFDVVATGKIVAGIFGDNGPTVTLTAGKTNLTFEASFEDLGWSLWKLIQTMGYTDSVSIPDEGIQQKVEDFGVLESISGTICAKNQPTNSICAHSVRVSATLLKGELINIDGYFKLSAVVFEFAYEKKATNGEASFIFSLSAIWEVAGEEVTCSAELEVPTNIGTGGSSRRAQRKRAATIDTPAGKRQVIWGSHMREINLPPRRRQLLAAAAGPSSSGLVPVSSSSHSSTGLATRDEARPLKFVFTLESPKLPIGPVLADLATSIVPTGLEFITDALRQFYILDFIMQVIYEKPNYQFRVAGTPSPVPGARFEVIAGKLDDERVAALAIVVKVGSFSSINKILSAVGSKSMDFNKVPVAPSNAGTSIFGVISYTTVDIDANEDWRWYTPEISGESEISKGLMLAADFGFPDDCQGDSVCTTMKGFLGKARLRVAIKVKSGEFSVGASLVNLRINDDWTLNKVGFELTLGTTNKMAFVGELSVKVSKDSTLTFGVEVAAIFTPAKVELRGCMAGLWSNAFGIPRFAVGNIVIAIAVTATSPVLGLPMPAFVVGGELAIGPQPCYQKEGEQPKTYICADWTADEKLELADPRSDSKNGGAGSTERKLCGALTIRRYFNDKTTSPCKCRCCELQPAKPKAKCIGGAGYVGIDPQDPDANWFGIKLQNIVLQSIFDAFVEGAVVLPKVIAETGFPGKLTLSYSMVKEQEPVKGVVFPKGIYFKGAFNLFGYTGKAEIAVQLDNGILVDAELAPLIIGGDIFKLVRNKTHENLGPKLYIDARGIKMFLPTIQGSARASLFGNTITTECRIDIEAPQKLRVFFEADWYVFYAMFNISAELSFKGWPGMSVGAQVVFGKLDVAQKFVAKVLGQISAWAQEGANKIADAQRDVDKASLKLKKAKGDVCDKEKCTRAVREWQCTSWAKKIECPPQKHCNWWEFWCWAENLANLVCDGFKAIVTWFCQFAEWVTKTFTDEICAIGCAVTSAAMEVANVALGAVQLVLEGVKFTFRVAAAVLKALTDALNFLQISDMWAGFDFKTHGLSLSTGKIWAGLKGLVAKKTFDLSFEIDLADLIGTAIKFFTQSIKPVLQALFGGKQRRQLSTGQLHRRSNDSGDDSSYYDLPELADVLQDPAVRRLLANSKIYRTTHLPGIDGYHTTHESTGQGIYSIDLQFLPEGEQGFLQQTTEYKGDIPHRTKWDTKERRMKKRSEMVSLWEKHELQGEKMLEHLERHIR